MSTMKPLLAILSAAVMLLAVSSSVTMAGPNNHIVKYVWVKPP